MSDKDLINFVACIAPTASAIRYDGNGGGRVQLDFADDAIPQVNRLLDMRGKAFLVVISPLSE